MSKLIFLRRFFSAIAYNVFAVYFGRFGTVFYRNVSMKITVSTHLQRKIIVFPAGTTFANALVSARLEQTVCYKLQMCVRGTLYPVVQMLNVFFQVRVPKRIALRRFLNESF